MIRTLALLACIFTLCITAASAFIRNTQTGLGCEPWPQCLAAQGEARAGSGVLRMAPSSASPGVTDAVFVARALHRISAVLVGLLALGIVLFGWSRFDGTDRIAASFAIVDTVFLSWLGRYTPHDLPLVTLGNVLGGFALAAAFGWIAAGSARVRSALPGPPARLAWVALALVGLQSGLGVMIGARGAVGVCDRPLCLPQAAVDSSVFDPEVTMAIASVADGQAIHVAHRLLALVVAACVLLLVLRAGAARSGIDRGRRIPAIAALACVVLLAPLGFATASGMAGAFGGTIHNVLAATCFALLAVAGRAKTVNNGIDSH